MGSLTVACREDAGAAGFVVATVGAGVAEGVIAAEGLGADTAGEVVAAEVDDVGAVAAGVAAGVAGAAVDAEGDGGKGFGFSPGCSRT